MPPKDQPNPPDGYWHAKPDHVYINSRWHRRPVTPPPPPPPTIPLPPAPTPPIPAQSPQHLPPRATQQPQQQQYGRELPPFQIHRTGQVQQPELRPFLPPQPAQGPLWLPAQQPRGPLVSSTQYVRPETPTEGQQYPQPPHVQVQHPAQIPHVPTQQQQAVPQDQTHRPHQQQSAQGQQFGQVPPVPDQQALQIFPGQSQYAAQLPHLPTQYQPMQQQPTHHLPIQQQPPQGFAPASPSQHPQGPTRPPGTQQRVVCDEGWEVPDQTSNGMIDWRQFTPMGVSDGTGQNGRLGYPDRYRVMGKVVPRHHFLDKELLRQIDEKWFELEPRARDQVSRYRAGHR